MKRVCVVTGATSGIGRATVERFLSDGFSVFAMGRRKEALVKLTEAWPAVVVAESDLREDRCLEQQLVSASAAFNQAPSVVVLSAGQGLRGGLLSSDPSKWNDLVQINQISMMRQMRQTAEYLRKASESSQARDMVVIGSTVGRQVSAANPIYGATKFALHSLCESLRQELCSEGIRVSLVEPGFVKTGFQAMAGYDPKWFAQLEVEQGPFLTPEDVADVISFVVTRPKSIHIDDVRIRPTRQKV